MRLATILLGAALLVCSAPTLKAKKLTILHTNDTHSQIDPRADGYGGAARRKALIDSVRDNNQNVIVVDCGDIVQGTLFFNIYKGEVEEKVMNAIGYDLRILGNHEFDNGIDDLAANLKNANALLLAANYQIRNTPLDGLFEPYVVYDIDNRRIAFMPVNLNPVGMISGRNYVGMGYLDAIETANNMAWYLKNVMQADIVVALTHIGYSSSSQPCDVSLIKSSKDIDIVLGGHSHTKIDPDDPKSSPHVYKNAEGRDVLVAQTGRYGSYVGEVTINLDDLDAFPTSRLISVTDRFDDRIDPGFEAIIAPYRAAVDSLNHQKVARAAVDMPKESAQLLNFTTDFVAARGRQMAQDVDFGILNKGSLRNDIPAGDITEGQVITLIPFFNRIQVIDIKGEDLYKAFDVMARVGGNGVSSEVDITFDPDTDRCLEAKLNGKPIDPQKTYRVATNDYVANGGDYMSSMREHTLVAESPVYLYEDLLTYLRENMRNKKINPSSKVRMRPVKNS